MGIKINIKEINNILKKGTIEDVRELNLSKRNASELEDISACKALQKIHLNENNLQKFEGLSKCESLKWIDLSKNQVQKITGLTRLVHLNILNLSYNKISKIEGLDTQIELKVLILNDNQINKVEGISHLGQLNTLSNHNDIALSARVMTMYVVLSDNKIGDLGDIPKVESLVKLSLSGNMLKDVSGIGSLLGLTELRLNRNGLKVLPKTFSALSKLKILDVGNNQIAEPNQISIISELESLKNFNVKGNPYWDEKESENLTIAIIKLNVNIDHINNRKVTQELKDQADAHEDEKIQDKETIEKELVPKPTKKIEKDQPKAPQLKNTELVDTNSQGDPHKEEDEEESKVVNKRQIGIVKVSVSKPLLSKQSKVVSKSILSQFNKKDKFDAWD